MKRIFTAIDISAEARTACAEYARRLQNEFKNLRVGWEKPEKLHLTLKFLGDISEKQSSDLTEAVAETARQISDFKLQISETGVFPAPKKARILWFGVKDETGSLTKLNQILESECERRGFGEERRNFKPHLTIARLREPHKAVELIERHLNENFESEEFTVSSVTIYESLLQKSGSLYSVVSKCEFGNVFTLEK